MPASDAVHVPLGLLAELTHRCPLGCPYCSNPLALDRRHEDGEHWIELGIFPSRFLAQEALERHVGDGDDDASSYRLRKV